MPGLTPLGTIHTAISVVALAAGFGIFQHGGFGKPHALGILTLLVIAFAAWPGGASLLGARWRYVSAVSYSFTLFLHLIPGLTETFTRLPAAGPVFGSPDDPVLQQLVGGLLALFVAGSVWQVRRLRSAAKPPGALVLPAAGNSLR